MLFENSALVGRHALSTHKLVTDASKYSAVTFSESIQDGWEESFPIQWALAHVVLIHKERDKALLHPAIMKLGDVCELPLLF